MQYLLLHVEMARVGKPCLRMEGVCTRINYHFTTPSIRRCTRCRTREAINLFPEAACRLLSRGMIKHCAILGITTYDTMSP